MRGFLVLWILAALPLSADVVRLKSGRVVEGTVESGPADPIVIRLEDGSIQAFAAGDVIDTRILLRAPSACLNYMDGTEHCGLAIERVSNETIALIDLNTGELTNLPWEACRSVRFTSPLTAAEILQRIRTDFPIELELHNGTMQSARLERNGGAEGRLRLADQLVPIPAGVKSPTVIRSRERSFLRPALLFPGYEQFRTGRRISGALLASGTALFAGLAGWSYVEAERARKGRATGVVPLGGFLGTLSTGRSTRFKQNQTLNHLALGGLASMFILNAVQISAGPTSAQGGRSMELGILLRF